MTNTDHEALMDHDDPALSGRDSPVEGYVVDLACLRRYPPTAYRQRAQEHTVDCALMGHCVESGYALVDEAGRPHRLDSHATGLMVQCLQDTDRKQGIYVRADRQEADGEMVTVDIVEVTPSVVSAEDDDPGV